MGKAVLDFTKATSSSQEQTIAHTKRTEQRKPTQSKPDMTQGCQRSLQGYRCQGYAHRQCGMCD